MTWNATIISQSTIPCCGVVHSHHHMTLRVWRDVYLKGDTIDFAALGLDPTKAVSCKAGLSNNGEAIYVIDPCSSTVKVMNLNGKELKDNEPLGITMACDVIAVCEV